MQSQLNLTVTIDDSELLDEEIRKAAEASAKNVARQAFEKTMHEETGRLIKKNLDEWNSSYSRSDARTRLKRTVDDTIDEQLTKHIKELSVSSSDIQERVNARLDAIDSRVDEYIVRKCSKLDLEAIIRDEVAIQCKAMVPQQMLQMFASAAMQQPKQD